MYATVVLLRYGGGFSVAEISEALDVPFDTAKTRLRRALEALKKQLKDEPF